MYLLFIELFIILLFAVACFLAFQSKKLDVLLFASTFAFFFENLNMFLFKNVYGGYFYNENFVFFLFDTPLFVILSWGILIFSSYMFAKRLGLDKLSRVLFVPILVVNVDLLLEVFAVFQGYWTWIGVHGFLFAAVPPANFIGWLGVSLGFMLAYEYLPFRWLSTFAGYAAFLLVSSFAYTVCFIFDCNLFGEYIVFMIILFALIIAYFVFRKRVSVTFSLFDFFSPLLRIPFFVAAAYLFIFSGVFSWLVLVVFLFVCVFEGFHYVLLINSK